MVDDSPENPHLKIAMVSLASAADQPEINTTVPALADALTEQGQHVVCYARRAPDQPPIPDGVDAVNLRAGPAKDLTEREVAGQVGRFGKQLGTALRKHRPDVVHSHGWLAGLAAQVATRGTPIPVVHTFHRLHLLDDRGTPAARREPTDRYRLERAVARSCDQVLAATDAERACLLRVGVDRDRITVVRRGVDARSMRPRDPAERHGPVYRVALLGALNRAQVAIRALTALPGTELVIAAGWPDHPETEPELRRLAELAEELHLTDRVSLSAHPDRAERAELLRRCDAAVLLSPDEEADTLSLEAMALGVPVLTGSPELTEGVLDGVTGLHLTPGGPPARELAHSLRRLFDNDALRDGMGLAARDRALSRYSWARIAAETSRVYQDLYQVGAPAASGV